MKLPAMMMRLKHIWRTRHATLTRRCVWLLVTLVIGAFPLQSQAQFRRSSPNVPVVLPAWLGQQRPSFIGELARESPQTWLVQGEVVENVSIPQAVNHRAYILGHIHITHVYAGPVSLQGQNFKILFNNEDVDVRGFPKGTRVISAIAWQRRHPLSPPEGELVNIEKKYLVWRAYNLGRPEKIDGSPSASEIEAHAHRVEMVNRADPLQQKVLLKQYALQQLPLTSEWAIHSISTWNTDDGYTFLTQTAQKPGLSVAQMIWLDQQLFSNQQSKWQNSPVRLALLRRLVAVPETHEEAALVLAHTGFLFGGYWKIDLEPPVAKELISGLLVNPSLSQADRENFVATVGYAYNGGLISKEDAFSLWRGLLLNPQRRDVAGLVAQFLDKYKPWTAEQLATLSPAVQQLKAAEPQALPTEAAQLRQAIALLQPLLQQIIPTAP